MCALPVLHNCLPPEVVLWWAPTLPAALLGYPFLTVLRVPVLRDRVSLDGPDTVTWVK